MGIVKWNVGQQAPVKVALVAEPEVGPWTNDPTWGQRYQNPLPSREGAVLPVFTRDKFPGPPRVRTIQLFRSDVVIDDTANADVRARVSYGVGGVNNVFDLDWIQGAQFSLLCSNVRVDAVTIRPDEGNTYGAGGNIITLAAATGTLAPAAGAPNTWSSQWHLLRSGIAGEDRITVPVPDFARAFRVNWAANGFRAVEPTADEVATTVVHGASFGFYRPETFNTLQWVPLSLGVRSIFVQNQTPAIANPTNVQVVFQLGI